MYSSSWRRFSLAASVLRVEGGLTAGAFNDSIQLCIFLLGKTLIFLKVCLLHPCDTIKTHPFYSGKN